MPRKYTVRQVVEKRNFIWRALVSTQIKENPYMSKYVIDILSDCVVDWYSREKTKKLSNPFYIIQKCPLSLEGIRVVSEYLYKLNFIRNGNANDPDVYSDVL
jgi:hypothetical protein